MERQLDFWKAGKKEAEEEKAERESEKPSSDEARENSKDSEKKEIHHFIVRALIKNPASGEDKITVEEVVPAQSDSEAKRRMKVLLKNKFSLGENEVEEKEIKIVTKMNAVEYKLWERRMEKLAQLANK